MGIVIRSSVGVMRMKWLGRALVWIVLAALIGYFSFLIPRLPASPEGIVREANTSWAGVLRLWVCGGWSPGYGSFTPWLNACLGKFEKRNAGVYVQVTSVSEQTLREFFSGDINPPDLILFAPGILDSPEGLYIIEETGAVRGDLADAGRYGGALYALPVAMGGYALAYDTAKLTEIPDDWRALGEPPQKAGRNAPKTYWLNWPADGAYTSWSAALLSVFADRVIYETREKNGASARPPVGDGVDLGLPIATVAPEAIEAPTQTAVILEAHLPGERPDSFRTAESVYSNFTRGEAACIPVTQREIRRLQVLSDSGKGPEWAVRAVGDGFTDQLAMLAVVDTDKADGKDRERLSRQLLEHFLSEESQQALSAIRAFPVIETDALYERQQGMNVLEAYLRATELCVPGAFESGWRAQRAQAADEWVEKESKETIPDE